MFAKSLSLSAAVLGALITGFFLTFNIVLCFQELPKLRFISLLDSRIFKDFQKQFPEIEISCLKENYGILFCFESLKAELIVVFRNTDIHKESVTELCQYLVSHLVVNIKTERSFSALKRIKSFREMHKYRIACHR